MKKILYLIMIMLGFGLVGLNNVYAADDDGEGTGDSGSGGSTPTSYTEMFIFDEDQNYTTCTVSGNSYSCTGGGTHFVNIGDTITYEARTCTLNADQLTGTSIVIAKSDCTPVTATWTSSDPSIYSVSGGVVTVNQYGTATITATAGEFSHSFVLSIDQPTDPTPSTPDDPTPSTPTTDWNWKRLFIVDNSTTTVTFNEDTYKTTPSINKTLRVGETYQLKAIICDDQNATKSGSVKSWAVSSCTQVSGRWSIGDNSSALTINSSTGLVKAVKAGFGFSAIVVEVDTPTLGENESFNNAHNLVFVEVINADYQKGKTTTIQKDNEFVDDVYTSGNPPTGNKALYMIPFMLTGGSYLVFRRKRIMY